MNQNRLLELFKPSHYKISLDLTEAIARKFRGNVEIHGTQIKGQEIKLHSKDLVVTEIKINGRIVEFSQYDDLLTLTNKENAKDLILQILYEGTITDQMHGIYPSYYKLGNTKHEIISTQFESHYAREAFPCIDEPSAKATFQLEIISPKSFEVLSNTNIESLKIIDKNKTTVFKNTPPMSTYLLAFAVGEFNRISRASSQGVEVSVLSSKANKVDDLKFSLETSIKILDFYESFFGVKYPLEKIDHIAIPDFSAGAMENWGLITYREESLILTDDSALDDKKNVAKVIAHELAHQWFGNLVTMKWWNDLWLNESFATFIEYLAIDKIFPDWNIWSDFSASEVIYALQRDCYDMVQSVRIDVDDPAEIGAIFDGAIVYAKGARLLKMLYHYVGEDTFKKSLNKYFNDFAYKNTDADDLWSVLSEVSLLNINELMHPWLEKPGYPIIEINDRKLIQHKFNIGKTKKLNTIWPVLLDSNNEKIPTIMKSRSIRLPRNIGDYDLNISNSSHFISLLDESSYNRKLKVLSSDSSKIIQNLQFVHEQLLISRAGMLEYTKLLSLLGSIKNQQNYLIWHNGSLIISDIYKLINTDKKAIKSFNKFLAKTINIQLKSLGVNSKINDTVNDVQLRSTICALLARINDKTFYKHAKNIFDQNDFESIDPELRSSILVSVIKNSKDNKLAEAFLKKYSTTNSPSLKSDLILSITSYQDKQFKNNVFKEMKNSEVIRHQDLIQWLASYLTKDKSRRETWSWIQNNWKWIEKTFEGDNSLDYFPKILARNFVTDKEFSEYKSFFRPLRNNKLLKRAIEMGTLEIEARNKIMKKEKINIINYLNNL